MGGPLLNVGDIVISDEGLAGGGAGNRGGAGIPWEPIMQGPSQVPTKYQN